MSILANVPESLLDDIVTGNCVPIIGAGFSRNAILPPGEEMPDWDKLGNALADLIPEYPYSSPLDAVSAYSFEYSRVKLVEKLVELLHIENAMPGPVHKAFSELPFEIVCTTNFDFLLEKAYDMGTSRVYCRPVIDEDHLSVSKSNGGMFLLKFHGDLHHPDRLIMTEEDYDSFLSRYPLLATYLGHLLITKTPLFIGYSLEDQDFRQIWQVIKDRLGKMRRPAYVITVDAQSHEIGRFERRGVKVLNLPGRKEEYDKVLEEFFTQLREYWPSDLLKKSILPNEQSLDGFAMPKDTTNRLCYVSVPHSLLSFYKSSVFPIIEEMGFVPITVDSIISPGDNILTKVMVLIDKAQLVVFDLSNTNVFSEIKMALTRKPKPPKLLVVMEEKTQVPLEIIGFSQVIRPRNLISLPDKFLSEIEEWFRSESDDLRPHFFDEPDRLLQKGENRSAVISAFTLLEITLQEALLNCNNISFRERYKLTLNRMSNEAFQCNLINEEDLVIIRDASQTRNLLVHTNSSIKAETAEKLVSNLKDIINRLRKQILTNE